MYSTNNTTYVKFRSKPKLVSLGSTDRRKPKLFAIFNTISTLSLVVLFTFIESILWACTNITLELLKLLQSNAPEMFVSVSDSWIKVYCIQISFRVRCFFLLWTFEKQHISIRWCQCSRYISPIDVAVITVIPRTLIPGWW